MTALTLFPQVAASSTLATADTLATAAAGTATSIAMTVAKRTGIHELQSVAASPGASLAATGTAVTLATTGVLAPSGKGWLFDVTTLEGKQLVAGSVAAIQSVLASATTISGRVYVRFYKRSSGGVFTGIALWDQGAGTAFTTSATARTLPSASISATTFATGDKLYVDVFVDVTANTANSTTATISVVEAGTTGAITQYPTAGYVAALTQTASDSAGGTDAVTDQRMQFVRSGPDSAPATDSVALAFQRTGSDSLGGTDAATRTLPQPRSSSDSAGASDGATVARQLSVLRAAVDTAAAADVATKLTVDVRTGTDSLPLTDSAAPSGNGGSRTGADSAGGSDSASGRLMLARATSDSAPASDERQPPTFVGASTATTGGSGGQTLNVAVPAGIAVGDKMLLFVFNTATSNGAPTGWTTEVAEFTGPGLGGSFSSRASAYSKTVTSGDIGATVTMTFNVGSSSAPTLGLIVAYRAASGVDVKASSSIQSTSYSAPRPTTTGANDLIVHAAVSHVAFTSTTPVVTLDAGFTQRATVAQGTVANDAKTAVVGDVTQVAVGQTIAASDTDAGANNEWLGFTVALSGGGGIARQVSLPRTASDSLGGTDLQTGTITDNFNRADSTTSANPSSDGGSWTTVGTTAVLGIVGNAGRVVTLGSTGLLGGAYAGAVRDTGRADVDMTITNFRNNANGASAFVFGYDQATRTGYAIQRTSTAGSGSSGLYQLRLLSGDSSTNLGGLILASDGTTDVVRITRVAATGVISLYLNGVFQTNHTDTTYLTGTSVGWGANVNYAFDGGTFDDFSASALTGPPATITRSRTGSDSAGVSDVATRTSARARTAVDSSPATDVATRQLLLSRTASDSAPAADNRTASVVLPRTGTDSAPATDTAVIPQPSRTAADTAHATDVATRLSVFARTVSDAEPATDATTRATVFARTTADAAPAIDAATRARVTSRTASDSSPATDVAARSSQQIARTVADAAHATESAATGGTRGVIASDSAPATDAATRALRVTAHATDSLGVTDSPARATSELRTSVDGASTSDAATRSLRDARTSSESAPAVDANTPTGTRGRTGSDAAAATDSTSRTVARARTGSDGAQALDSAAPGLRLFTTASDSAPAVDFGSGGRTLSMFVADAATATDVASRALALLRSLTDSAPASDSAAGVVSVAPRDIEVTIFDLYVTITFGEPQLASVVFDAPVDAVSIGNPLDPITLGSPGL